MLRDSEELSKLVRAFFVCWVICGLLHNHRAKGSGTLRAESRHDPA